MQYLTLHDLPHRPFNSPGSRNMTSDERRSSDRVGALPPLTADAHAQRNSPPLQPGEHRPAATSLPSFSQLLMHMRETSPPRTPRRKPRKRPSVENSPTFGEVDWAGSVIDGKRRCVADSYRTTAGERQNCEPHEPRRPSGFDSALPSNYGSPRTSLPPPVPTSQHRSSLSLRQHPSGAPIHYGQPPPAETTATHGNVAYQQPQTSSTAASATYPQGSHYDLRPSYYQDSGHSRHGQESYYPRTTYTIQHHPAYLVDSSYQQPGAPYSNYTFHPGYGIVDQNAFNRKRRGNLPKEATGILKEWFRAHKESPYPTEEEKIELCRKTGLNMNQVSNWFINARRRTPKDQRDVREGGSDDV